MRLPSFSFRRYGIRVICLVLILGFGILTAPSKSLAQSGAAPQDVGQTTMAPAASAQPKPAVVLPEGDGKAIATEYCQDCHRLTNLTKARKAPDDWHDTVQTMMDRGARLPQDKFDVLVQYLAQNFGPQTATPPVATPSAAAAPSDATTATASQQPKPVELPEGDGKAIATELCQGCHKLTNLTKAHKSLDDWRDTLQTMVDRGATVPQDKIETLVQYLAKNFGPKDAAATAGTASPDASPAASSLSNH